MNMTNENKATGESTASREYNIRRFPSGWYGYKGKTRVKDFSGSKAEAQAWVDKMNGVERKPTRFTKIVNDLPVYGSGTITSAYLLEDGCVVGYCKETKEWLKWNSKGQLHTSCGKTREDAAMLFTDEPASWVDNNMVENAKIIANARTKPTHSERVRALVARRDARIAKKRKANWRKLENPEGHDVAHELKSVRHQLGCAQRTAADRLEKLKKCSCGAIAPELCSTYGHLETKRGNVELLDEAYKQQNFHARYINVTAITAKGAPICTQHRCASNDDITELHRRIISWTTRVDGEVILRVWLFDTFTETLHELVIADGDKFFPVVNSVIAADKLAHMMRTADRVATKDGHEWGWQLQARELLNKLGV